MIIEMEFARHEKEAQARALSTSISQIRTQVPTPTMPRRPSGPTTTQMPTLNPAKHMRDQKLTQIKQMGKRGSEDQENEVFEKLADVCPYLF